MVTEPARAFRQALSKSLPLLGVGIHNPLTAALASQEGIDLLWLSSLELSTSRMLPDANVLGFSDVVSALREIVIATPLPVIVDADNGYGSDAATRLAARHFAAAGAAAVCIEDNAFPKQNSFQERRERPLVEIESFCARIEAARAGGEIPVIARTEALIAGLGAEEAVRRARAYAAAGADVLFIQTRASTLLDFWKTLEQVRGLAPILLTPTAIPERTPAQLHALGIDIVIHSNIVIRTVVRAVRDVLAQVGEGRSLEHLNEQLVPLSEVLALTQEAEPPLASPLLRAQGDGR
jgi:phosphoenolpyruvate phosphomutase